jgi:hypothetical protein
MSSSAAAASLPLQIFFSRDVSEADTHNPQLRCSSTTAFATATTMMRRPRLFSNHRIGAEAARENAPNDPQLRPILVHSGSKHSEESNTNSSERTTTSSTMTEEEQDSSSATSTSRRPKQKSLSSVTFETVTIREFGYELGDHPWTRDGVPLSLGWEPFDERSVPVDRYERMKRSPPGFPGNVLSTQQRRDILVRAGYPVSLLLQTEVELDQKRRQAKLALHQEELRRTRRRQFAKDLRSLRFGILGASPSSSARRVGDKRSGASSSTDPSLSAR